MKFVLFYHSLISDWNHGNAHFLRGVVTELLARGHRVEVYEPAAGWSLQNLKAEHGETAISDFFKAYPQLHSTLYESQTLDLDYLLEGADVVIVHEWNTPQLVRRIGRHRSSTSRYRLLFHDTHHRSVTDPQAMTAYDLSHYDGVLAFGRVIRDIYLHRGWAAQAWTWHEAADTRVFRPVAGRLNKGDLVWIGNWGDGERAQELHEFLLEPIHSLGLRARIHGVRYPREARETLRKAGISYGGWLPNYRVPETFARFRVTVHVPRRPYRQALPGIPTIRPFEALACGIPLITAPWDDVEGLFAAGTDYLVAHHGREMKRHLRALLTDREMAQALASHGLRTLLSRHTCAHRVDELLAICRRLGLSTASSQNDPQAIQSGLYQDAIS